MPEPTWQTKLRAEARAAGFAAYKRGQSEMSCPYFLPKYKTAWVSGYLSARMGAPRPLTAEEAG